MQDDLISKKENSIDDLIKSAHNPGKIKISSDEVEDKLKSKIKELESKKKEEAAMQEAAELGYDHITLKGFPIIPEALILIPEAKARELKAVCFFKTDTELRIGAVNPNNKEVKEILNNLNEELQVNGQIYKISEQSLEAAIELYKTIPIPRKSIPGIEIKAEDLEKFKGEIGSLKDISQKLQHVNATDLINIVMSGAIQVNSSDVHIEAEQDDIKIRYRIDGALYEVAIVPKKDWSKIVNRVKLVSKLKINVVDVPQDGRFTIYLKDEFVDVRVSTVPSAYGESIVMRLLMSSAVGLELENIGLVGRALEIMKEEMIKPNGMILTTGPTGSGKTSTLYAILKKINKPEDKIITLENPIEYRLDGITQSQVESSEQAEEGKQDIRSLLESGGSGKKHFTYASGLRAVLRQDPDIVMVGEIRDHETAEIATQAALTGHLMLSTLHTNSAAGAIPRLISMEVKPFLLAPSLNVIIGQRLVRKICEHCKEEYQLEDKEMKQLKEVIDALPEDLKKNINLEGKKFYHGKGCEKCSDIGFKGRVGIFEILTMNEEIEKLILTGQVSEYQITEIAQKHGMLTMRQDGILKVLEGMTTIGEVLKETD
ncbi:MAG: GspE/PulE family protein [bacterium]|nr:GspE/PulE family protein [bacterium]